jgi:hypothetical protein
MKTALIENPFAIGSMFEYVVRPARILKKIMSALVTI